MEEKVKLIYPEECGMKGSVTYKFTTDGVYCEIISHNNCVYHKQTGFAEFTDKGCYNGYNIQGMARYALRQAREAYYEKCDGV